MRSVPSAPHAPRAGPHASSLPQVLFHALRLAQQKRDVQPGRLEEAIGRDQRLLELLVELDLLLVAPALAQAVELPAQDQHLVFQLGAEALEVVGEPAELG